MVSVMLCKSVESSQLLPHLHGYSSGECGSKTPCFTHLLNGLTPLTVTLRLLTILPDILSEF